VVTLNALLAAILSEVAGLGMSHDLIQHWDMIDSLVLKTSLAMNKMLKVMGTLKVTTWKKMMMVTTMMMTTAKIQNHHQYPTDKEQTTWTLPFRADARWTCKS
jgi:hypothetical protein